MSIELNSDTRSFPRMNEMNLITSSSFSAVGPKIQSGEGGNTSGLGSLKNIEEGVYAEVSVGPGSSQITKFYTFFRDNIEATGFVSFRGTVVIRGFTQRIANVNFRAGWRYQDSTLNIWDKEIDVSQPGGGNAVLNVNTNNTVSEYDSSVPDKLAIQFDLRNGSTISTRIFYIQGIVEHWWNPFIVGS